MNMWSEASVESVNEIDEIIFVECLVLIGAYFVPSRLVLRVVELSTTYEAQMTTEQTNSLSMVHGTRHNTKYMYRKHMITYLPNTNRKATLPNNAPK